MLQWGHGPKAVETSWGRRSRRATSSGFDGATARRPWRRKPRTVETPGSPGFNGATARRPWRLSRRPATWQQGTSLQWGHGPKAVETSPSHNASIIANRLQWGHGPKAVETATGWGTLGNGWKLQWGHGPKAVETRGDAKLLKQLLLLQWGHGPKAVETYYVSAAPFSRG